MRTIALIAIASTACACSGCAPKLKGIRSKTESGGEWRHSGTSRHDDERYSVQQGIEFQWDKGITTGIKYRRRDVNDGGGDGENGLWLDFGIPLWQAKENNGTAAARIASLEERVAELERLLARKGNDEG